MPKFTVDFTNVKDSDGERVIVPQGQYHVRVSKVTEEKANTGKNRVKVIYILFKNGLSVHDDLYLTEKSYWRLKGFLEAIEQPTEGQQSINTDNWINKELLIDVDIEEYTNNKGVLKTINKVRAYNNVNLLSNETPEGVQSVNNVGNDEIPF